MIDTLVGLSSMATKQLVSDLAGLVQERFGIPVRFTSVGGVQAAEQVHRGTEADIVVLGEEAMVALDGEGFLVTKTLRPMFVSEVVAAIPAHSPPLPLVTEEDLRAALQRAEKIAYSTGPSGTALVELMERWGLMPRLSDRLVQAPPGVPVGNLLTRGAADLAFQQFSELKDLHGVHILGSLPGGAAIRTTFSGAVLPTSLRPQLSEEVLQLMTSDQMNLVVTSAGMTAQRVQRANAPVLTRVGTAATPRPERYVKQLLSHWSTKTRQTREGPTSTLVFDNGNALTISATDGSLYLRTTVLEGEDLNRFAEVVTEHLQRSGRKDELEVRWVEG